MVDVAAKPARTQVSGVDTDAAAILSPVVSFRVAPPFAEECVVVVTLVPEVPEVGWQSLLTLTLLRRDTARVEVRVRRAVNVLLTAC